MAQSIFNQTDKGTRFMNKKYRSTLVHSSTQQARKIKKKSRQKNSWNQIIQFFFVKLHFWHFSQFKNWFLAIFEIAKKKMEFGQKNYSLNWFIWFHEFFWPGLLKFSGTPCLYNSDTSSALPVECRYKIALNDIMTNAALLELQFSKT